MFHIAKRQEMIFFLILGGLPKKKAPVSHRCLFMEIFLFSGIQSTSESFIETFAVPPFDAKPATSWGLQGKRNIPLYPYK